MAIEQIGVTVVCGVPQRRYPLRGFPKGKQRLILRPGRAAMLYVRPPEGGVRSFYIKEDRMTWIPAFEAGGNVPG